MALFPPLEFGGPSYSYSGQPSTSLLFQAPSRGGLGLFDRSSRKSRRRAQVLDPFFTSDNVLQPDSYNLQAKIRQVPSLRHSHSDPLARDAPKYLSSSIKPTPLPAFDVLRSVPTQVLKLATITKPSISTSLPLSAELELLKQNRLEFIAELFITIVTTRADALSLITSSTNVLHPEETVYKFKDVNNLLQPSLSRSTSEGGGKDVFSSMYRPQAAKNTKSTLTGRNTRLWRMGIASLLLRSVPWSALDRSEGNKQQVLDHHEGEGPFHLASDNFNILYELLYQISAYSARGIEMTAVASKKAIFDMVCDYTVLGSASLDLDAKNGADKLKKIDYLSEVDEYQGRLIIYMAQVVAYFLIPNRRDPLLVKKLGNHPDIQGIVESTPAQIPTFAQVPQHSARMNREMEEIKYLLRCVDEGRFEPNLEDIRGQINELPPPLPLKKGLFMD